MPTENEHTPEFLKELQSMDMHSKVLLTQARIVEFYGGYHPGMYYGDAYVSFSGGKDSTVLLDIARKIYPDIPAVFSNTGLEYPEIRKFAMSHDNVEMVQPKMRFDEVISRYGYPLIGKEVAEAIYYARRLRPDKRERDGGASCRDERAQEPPYCADGRVPAFHTHTHTSERTSQHHRTDLNGTRQRSGRNFKGDGSEADEPG